MSYKHVRELVGVQDEYQAVRQSMNLVRATWNRVAVDMEPVTLTDLTDAMAHLEATYIVRLTANYEAILRDVLKQARTRRIDDKAGGADLTSHLSGWLQDQVRASAGSRQGIDRRRIAEIKDRARQVVRLLAYRNKLAHRKPPPEELFTFQSALTCLNRMLDLVP
jgi:hypothetical protein